MAAPAGVGSGSAPEPVVPEAAVTEPMALAPTVPEPSEPGPGENAAAIAIPEPSVPAPGETVAASAVPEPSEPGPGEIVARSADPEPDPPAEERVREGRRVGWLVTAGVAIVVIAAAAAAGVLAVATHGFRPKAVVTYRPAAVFALRAGDCINSSPNGLSVTILSCATPHQAEVFATFSLTGSGWPGSAAVQQQASDGCANRITTYLNPQLLNAGLTQEYVYPNQDAWKAGVRTVVCEVSAASGPLSGSVRQGG
jgi:Septum formation